MRFGPYLKSQHFKAPRFLVRTSIRLKTSCAPLIWISTPVPPSPPPAPRQDQQCSEGVARTSSLIGVLIG